MTKHTPGPWTAEIEHSGEVGWRVVSDAQGYPNDGWIIGGEMMGPDSEANARLIAAAPDMLAALKKAREYVVRVDGTMSFTKAGKRLTRPDLDMIDAAIAKAEP